MLDDNSVNETSKTSQSTVTPAHVQSFSYGDDEHVPVKSRTWKPNASAWTSVWAPVKRTVSWKETDYFDGKRGFIQGYVHRRPNRQKFPTEFGAEHPLHELEKGIDNKEYRHRDYFGRVSYKKKDVLRYISPTEYVPKRMIVQCAPGARDTVCGDWLRVKIKGKIPPVLALSEWALRPSDRKLGLRSGEEKGKRSFWGVVQTCLRVFLVIIPTLVLLSLPLEKAWESSEFDDSYTDFPNFYWEYPKHARNRMDAAPLEDGDEKAEQEKVASTKLSSKVRLLRPRQLVVKTSDGPWTLDPNPHKSRPYVFISYTIDQFDTDLEWDFRTKNAKDKEQVEAANVARKHVEAMAEAMAAEEGVDAYWLDYICRAPNSDKETLTQDVHCMCDVIRGARRVCVILRDFSLENKRSWGERMWTLPEGLLSAKQELKFCMPLGPEEPPRLVDTSSSALVEASPAAAKGPLYRTQVLTKLDLTYDVWADKDVEDGENQPTRLLAEHFSNVLTLSRLELFAIALEALTNKKTSQLFAKADRAYALMGLLHKRIQLEDKDESLFEGLARLSLENDSDRLMERMVCMLPAKSFAKQNDDKLFLSLTERDQYNSQLWDIEPLCQVAGVGEDKELILDACRGISIRWKAFPQIKYKRSAGFKKLLAELVLRSGAAWAALGLALIARYAYRWSSNQTLLDAPPPGADVAQLANDVIGDQSLVIFGAFCLLGSFLLALAAPASVRRLYGGRVMQSAPWLVGFEGVMPIDSLEETIFGNDDDRLTYEPSSTVFAEREGVQSVDLAKHPNVAHPRFSERIGKEPAWVRCPGAAGDPRVSRLPKGHRLFTLVDTGALTVSIFSAVRPPSVALLCGREGGMLRTVLCHYERSNNCLYKETVVRMDSMTLNQAKVLSWVKLSLGNA